MQHRNLPKTARTPSLFNRLESFLQQHHVLPQSLPLTQLPKASFIFLLGLIYVANTHYHDRQVRRIQQLTREVDELRADFTTQQAAYMRQIRQSTVASQVAPLGLAESTTPPWPIAPK